MCDPADFWGSAAADIEWFKPATVVLEKTEDGTARWFADGRINVCFNALDRHVASGRGDQTAIIYDSPVTSTVAQMTYRELLDEVARFADVLQRSGVEAGDTVVIYMPAIPRAVVAMLGCARIGAVHAVVFGGFAAPELAARIDSARPKVVLSASCGIDGQKTIPYKPILDEALALARHKVTRCIVLQRPQVEAKLVAGRDVDWESEASRAIAVDCVPVGANDPLYILYTSGTTGRPKGLVRDTGGYAVALQWSMRNVFDMKSGEVFWAASDIGWVVGHSYAVYGPLINANTTVLYEGKPTGTPDAGAFWRVISENRVSALFTAPTALRAIKKGAHLRTTDLSTLRALYVAGERLDEGTYRWASEIVGVPIVDNWWQTETGWPIVANCLGLEAKVTKPGSATVPVPGYDVRVLRTNGEEARPGEEGFLVVGLPLPPGAMTTIWDDHQRFRSTYFERFPGFYFSGDAGYIDDEGYVFLMGRVDDVINVAGHRLSTSAIEEVISGHRDVAECAVVGVADPLKGQIPLGFVVLKRGAEERSEEVESELVKRVREQIGAFVSLKTIHVVEALPKTRSGKIIRAAMRQIADGEKLVLPPTIDDASVLEDIRRVLQGSAR